MGFLAVVAESCTGLRISYIPIYLNLLACTQAPLLQDEGATHKGRPADPGEGGLRNPDIQLLFECDSIVLSGRRGRGSRNPGFSRTSFVNGP